MTDFHKLYEDNLTLDINQKIELITLFGETLGVTFDDLFYRNNEVSSNDLSKLLINYGPFWITIDSDKAPLRKLHAVVLCNVSSEMDEGISKVQYLDPWDGTIKTEVFSVFIKSVKDAKINEQDLKYSIVRMRFSPGEGQLNDKIRLLLKNAAQFTLDHNISSSFERYLTDKNNPEISGLKDAYFFPHFFLDIEELSSKLFVLDSVSSIGFPNPALTSAINPPSTTLGMAYVGLQVAAFTYFAISSVVDAQNSGFKKCFMHAVSRATVAYYKGIELQELMTFETPIYGLSGEHKDKQQELYQSTIKMLYLLYPIVDSTIDDWLQRDGKLGFVNQPYDNKAYGFRYENYKAVTDESVHLFVSKEWYNAEIERFLIIERYKRGKKAFQDLDEQLVFESVFHSLARHTTTSFLFGLINEIPTALTNNIDFVIEKGFLKFRK